MTKEKKKTISQVSPPFNLRELEKKTNLRKKAEELLKNVSDISIDRLRTLPLSETYQILHELRIYQIELEMQNDELRQTQIQLETTRARYFDLYDLAPVGYCVLSESGLILDSNLKLAEILNVDKTALENQPLSRYIYKDDCDAYYLQRRKLFQSTQPQSIEIRILKSDSQIVWVQISSTITSTDSGLAASKVTITDISNLKRTQQIAIQLSRNASMVEMSAGLAHEINNPLAIIMGSLKNFPNFIDNPQKLTSKAEMMLKAGERIETIVKSLKKYSEASLNPNKYEVRISTLIKSAITLTTSRIELHAIQIDTEVDQDATIRCNEVEIEQVLVNLLTNSIDAIKNQNERWIKIELLTESSDRITLRIADSGKGIPIEISNKIFEPFFTTKQTGAGVGLGLSMSKGILDSHGGSIELVANHSHTCFAVHLPTI